jgi:hypothetical protein
MLDFLAIQGFAGTNVGARSVQVACIDRSARLPHILMHLHLPCAVHKCPYVSIANHLTNVRTLCIFIREVPMIDAVHYLNGSQGLWRDGKAKVIGTSSSFPFPNPFARSSSPPEAGHLHGDETPDQLFHARLLGSDRCRVACGCACRCRPQRDRGDDLPRQRRSRRRRSAHRQQVGRREIATIVRQHARLAPCRRARADHAPDISCVG